MPVYLELDVVTRQLRISSHFTQLYSNILASCGQKRISSPGYQALLIDLMD